MTNELDDLIFPKETPTEEPTPKKKPVNKRKIIKRILLILLILLVVIALLAGGTLWWMYREGQKGLLKDDSPITLPSEVVIDGNHGDMVVYNGVP